MEESGDDAVWTLDDMNLPGAPHHVIAVLHREEIADFRDLTDILDVLDEAPYRVIAARIDARLATPRAFDELDELDEPVEPEDR